MITVFSSARLEGDMRTDDQGPQVVHPGGADFRLDQPEGGLLPEDEFGPGIKQDMGGNGPLVILVDLDFLDETCLDAAIHDLGVALDDIDCGGEIEGHRDAVIGLLQVLVQLEGPAVLDGGLSFSCSGV